MTNDELSARVAEARGEKRERNVFRSKDINGNFFGPDDEFLPWPKPYATDMNHAEVLLKSIPVNTIYPEIKDGEPFWNVHTPDGVFIDMELAVAACRAYLAFKRIQF